MFNFKIKINNEHSLQTKVSNEHKIKTKLNNEHSFSIIAWGATVIYSVGGEIKYYSKTISSKAVILARIVLSNSYRSATSAKERFLARIRGLIEYRSSSRASEKILVKLSPLPLKGIPLNQYSDTLLKNLHKSLKHFSYITSDIYQSLTTTLYEKILVRMIGDETRYKYESRNIYSGIQAKVQGAIEYSSKTIGALITWVRARSVLTFASRLQASAIVVMRSSSSTLYKVALGVRDILFVKIHSTNKSSLSTESTKESIGAKTIGQVVKYVCSTTSNSINKVFTKVKIEDSFSSKTETDEEKIYEYYTIKLRSYEDKKLNEVPNSLLKFCYVVDKNWLSASMVYKTWEGVKERTNSWSDLK